MNTIKRPRQRPRVRSFNWRTFGWLLRRQTMLALWFHDETDALGDRRRRHLILSTHPYNCLSCTFTMLDRLEGKEIPE